VVLKVEVEAQRTWSITGLTTDEYGYILDLIGGIDLAGYQAVRRSISVVHGDHTHNVGGPLYDVLVDRWDKEFRRGS
jgi:hypothetical protein